MSKLLIISVQCSSCDADAPQCGGYLDGEKSTHGAATATCWACCNLRKQNYVAIINVFLWFYPLQLSIPDCINLQRLNGSKTVPLSLCTNEHWAKLPGIDKPPTHNTSHRGYSSQTDTVLPDIWGMSLWRWGGYFCRFCPKLSVETHKISVHSF